MLQDKSLSDEIVRNLNHEVRCKTYLTSIKTYIESNIEILATYTGVTPAGTPDPLNGPIKLNLQLTPTFVQGLKIDAFLETLREPNPASFIEAIFSELTLDVITGPLTHTLTATAIYTINNFTISELDKLKKAKDYVECWDIVCAPIVRTFKTLLSVPTVIPTTTASGAGTTVISSVL